MSKLSDRIRPNCEAAPWVISEVKRLEKALEEILDENKELRILVDDLLSYKYRNITKAKSPKRK